MVNQQQLRFRLKIEGNFLKRSVLFLKHMHKKVSL